MRVSGFGNSGKRAPNALPPEALAVMAAWGFSYKTNLIWHKVRKDGGSDGRGVGFYFRNVTEVILFGVRGKNARTLAPGRTQVNLLTALKRENSRNRTGSTSRSRGAASSRIWSFFTRNRARRPTWGNQATNLYDPCRRPMPIIQLWRPSITAQKWDQNA